MNLRFQARRRELLAMFAWAGLPLAHAASVIGPRALVFPADHGSHEDAHIEWWYVTGTLWAEGVTHGFQVTFFRSRGEVDPKQPSRFAARQLLFAHAAVTDMRARRLRHDQRIARAGFGIAGAQTGNAGVNLRDWHLSRGMVSNVNQYRALVQSDTAGFALDLTLDTTQPLLLQGEGGLSRKGVDAARASHYYSEPQLKVRGTLVLGGKPAAVTGLAWLDHEWSDSLLDAQTVGWDWIGMNLDDGAALTAFRLRRADGSATWAGGSYRAAGGPVRAFGPADIVFTPKRTWTSPSTRAVYPVDWEVQTPVGRYTVRARLDAQELDSRGSTGSVYWEGTSELLDSAARVVGSGYLEMTGYASALRL